MILFFGFLKSLVGPLFSMIGNIFSLREKKLTDEVIEAKSKSKVDKIADRDVRNEGKQLVSYDNRQKFLEELDEDADLYYGDRESVIQDLKLDKKLQVQLLTNKQRKNILRLIKNNKTASYFIVQIHPKTEHHNTAK